MSLLNCMMTVVVALVMLVESKTFYVLSQCSIKLIFTCRRKLHVINTHWTVLLDVFKLHLIIIGTCMCACACARAHVGSSFLPLCVSQGSKSGCHTQWQVLYTLKYLNGPDLDYLYIPPHDCVFNMYCILHVGGNKDSKTAQSVALNNLTLQRHSKLTCTNQGSTPAAMQ